MSSLRSLLRKKEFLERVNEEYRRLGITQEEIAKYITRLNEDGHYINQSQVSKKLTGKRIISYEEASLITQLLIGLSSYLPKEIPISELGTISDLGQLFHGYEDEKLKEFAYKMFDSTFSQAPILNRKTGEYVGIVSEETILKVLLTKPPKDVRNPLNQLSDLNLRASGVIDDIPQYPIDTPIAEIGQALLNYYALILIENEKQVGIVTRADFLKILFEEKYVNKE